MRSIFTKDGGYRWMEVFARLGRNDPGKITGTYGTLRDITEKKLAANFENELLHLTPKLSGFPGRHGGIMKHFSIPSMIFIGFLMNKGTSYI